MCECTIKALWLIHKELERYNDHDKWLTVYYAEVFTLERKLYRDCDWIATNINDLPSHFCTYPGHHEGTVQGSMHPVPGAVPIRTVSVKTLV